MKWAMSMLRQEPLQVAVGAVAGLLEGVQQDHRSHGLVRG